MVDQLLVCNGCCCGRVEKGHPEVPIETLKSAWNEHGLSEHIKLTISTCLGPCSMHNVSLLMTDNGRIWLGNLSKEEDYLAIVDWAIDIAAKGNEVQLPVNLEQHRFVPA